MSQMESKIQKTMIAAIDLSSYQFHLVYETATGVTFIGAVTTMPSGVLQDAPNALGLECNVSCGPIEKIVSDGSGTPITVGLELGVDTAGRVVALTSPGTTNVVSIGYALEASTAAGVIIMVDYHPCYKYQ